MFFRISLLTLLTSILAACGGASGTESEGQSYNPRTFSLSNNDLACIEFTAYSQDDEYQILSQGGTEGFCSQSETLGSCQQASFEYSYTFNTIFYKNAAGASSVQSLKAVCEQSQGSFTITDPNIDGNSGTVIERTYITQQDAIACTEYVSSTQAGQNQIISIGGIEGRCAREVSLGTCQRIPGGEISSINTVYYPDEDGLRSAESLAAGCEHIQGTFIFAETGPDTGPSEPEIVVERTYITQQDAIACTEYISSTQAGQSQIVGIGGIESSCSRDTSLGTCQRMPGGEISRINTVYYPDEAGLRTAESLVAGCEHIQGTFIFSDNVSNEDTTAPDLSESSMIGAVNTYTPSYSFNSSEAGTISYVGACSSSTMMANEGTNTITFNVLAAGFYDNCRIFVQDSAGNISSELNVSGFTVNDTSGPILSNISSIGKSYIQNPVLTFTSNEAGMIGWGGSCRSTELNFIDGVNRIELDSLNAGFYDDCSITAYDVNANPSDSISIAPFTVIILDTDGDGFTDAVEAEYGTDATDANSTPTALLANPVDFTDDNDSDSFSDGIEIWLDTNPNDITQSPIDENGDSIPDGFDTNTDTLAPRLLAIDMPDRIVIETGNEVVNFNLTIADNLSGISRVDILLRNSTWQTVYLSEYGASLGDKVHALSLNSSAFNQFSAAGSWSIDSISLEDSAGNYKAYDSAELQTLGLPTSLQVENINSDIVEPTLSDFSIVEDSITIISGQETVSFNVTVTDSLSGFGRVDIVLKSASGTTVYLSEYEQLRGQNSATLTVTSSEFGLEAEAGSWAIDYVRLEDSAGNFNRYTASDLNELTFENSIMVTK